MLMQHQVWTGEQLVSWRSAMRWSQQEAAEHLGMSRRGYQNLEAAVEIDMRTTLACRYLLEEEVRLGSLGSAAMELIWSDPPARSPAERQRMALADALENHNEEAASIINVVVADIDAGGAILEAIRRRLAAMVEGTMMPHGTGP